MIREPQQFLQDVFFTYGSQASYTFFPEILAWILGYFHPAETFLTLTLLGLCVFTGASYVLIRTLFPSGERFYALLAVLILPGGYGSHLIFSYAEPFFSGRSIAEPLVLASMAAWLSHRRWMAVTCWVMAASMHPLQALTLLVLAFSILVAQNQRWWHLLWLALPLVGLGLLDIAPFDQLITRQDPEWRNWISVRTPQVFVSSWQYAAWGSWLTDIFLGWLIVQHASGNLQRIARGAVIATILGMLATLVLADGLASVLSTGIQLWRTQWLLHWLAMVSIPMLIAAHCPAGIVLSPRTALLLATIAYGIPMASSGPSPLAVLGLIPLYLAWPWLPAHVSPWMMRFLRFFPWLALILGLVKYLQGIWNTYTHMDSVQEAILTLTGYPLVAGLFLYTGIRLWASIKRGRIIFIIILIFSLIQIVDLWDRRSPWTKNMESIQYSADFFGDVITPGAQVFWEDELLGVWLVLRRPSFLNTLQSSGIAFNRSTAAEIVRREKILSVLFLQKQICKFFDAFNGSNECTVDEERITEVCNDDGPDYMVLMTKLSIPPRSTRQVSIDHEKEVKNTYYLYKCTDFKSE